MVLSLQQVVPLPLRDKVTGNGSGIWNKHITFEKGSLVFIQAPSGTGKTTLIHILYRLRNDYEGIVRWGDSITAKINEEQLATLRAKNISVIFQDMRLFPDLTAWENLEIKRKLSNTVTQEKVLEWLDRLGLKDKKNTPAAIMSYGEQQRVSIIRALLQPFDWLLMDEPFSHLDVANTEKAITLIQEIVTALNAGMVLADLDDNNYFPYTQKIML